MPTDDHHSPAADLRAATFLLARRLRNQRPADEISDGQYSVLGALSRHGSHTLGELAVRERVTPPSMNRTVGCLEELGYVTRVADDDDRRKVNVALTDSGRQLVADTIRRRDAWLDAALDELSPGERATLAQAVLILRGIAER